MRGGIDLCLPAVPAVFIGAHGEFQPCKLLIETINPALRRIYDALRVISLSDLNRSESETAFVCAAEGG